LSSIDSLAKDLYKIIHDKEEKGPKPYEPVAEVVKVDENNDDILWVRIPGSEGETPVERTVSANVGDRVRVRVSGGRAWVIGNTTNPPTDDTMARSAHSMASIANDTANDALEYAKLANTKVEENAASMAEQVIRIDSDISGLQDQIDGNITTWFYDYAPTNQNYPANEWISEGTESEHLGDLFYNTTTGYAYRWMSDGADPPTYSWGRITDTDVTKALADAAQAQDTADHKRRVFINQPIPPYDVGDLWCVGTTGDILTCTTAKAEGEQYEYSDWSKLNKYTDDSALTSFISGTYSVDKISLQNQIDGKAETWYQSNDPSSAWTTSELRSEHEGDLWYNTTNNTTWYWDGSQWVQQNVPNEVFDKIDGKAQIFTSQPTPPYSVGDLWCVGTTGDILTCIRSRSSGSYVASDWEKRNKYTDDSALTTFISGTYSSDKTSLQSQIDGKAETWYQSSDPSTAWTTSALKNAHKGDLWYKTTDGTTWFWNGTQWVQENVPNEVFDKIDGKAQVFTSQPVPPYDVGDIWFVGTTGDIMTCVNARTSGNYVANDWQKRNKYTDDSALTTFLSGTYATDKTNLQTQIDGKAETWYQSSDPSTAWNTTALKNAHKGDLWYKTTDNTTWFWNGTSWVQENVPNTVFDKIDGKAQVFTSQPVPPYNVGDIWFVGSSGDILTCVHDRSSGNYVASDWEKRNKYTDDATANEAATKATYYLSSGEEGVMIADLRNGQSTPSTVTGRNVYIDADSVDIRDGQDVLASFGEKVTIGSQDTAHIYIDANSIKGISKNEYFSINATTTQVEQWISIGRTTWRSYVKYSVNIDLSNDTWYDSKWNAMATGSNFRVVVKYVGSSLDVSAIEYVEFIKGTEDTNNTYVTYDGEDTITLTASYPSIVQNYSYRDVSVQVYELYNAPVYKFGDKMEYNSTGAFSFLMGTGTYSTTPNQLVVGTYNAGSQGLFVVGNGTGNGDRSKAFEVLNTGDIYASGDTNLAAGKKYLINNHPLITSGTRTESNISINAAGSNGYTTFDIDIGSSSYKAIGLVGYDWSGDGVSYLSIYDFFIKGDQGEEQAHVGVRNYSSTARSGLSLKIYILYMAVR